MIEITIRISERGGMKSHVIGRMVIITVPMDIKLSLSKRRHLQTMRSHGV